ncbi:MAG: polysaccharide deacetylase family protein [Chthonomonadetes bacterium]|nr:polysaccharide deacetylase family protein [Chthonomonadetes bacterium]
MYILKMKGFKRLAKKLVAEWLYRLWIKNPREWSKGIVILMYHEIALRDTPVFRYFPVLCAAPESFSAQLDWLRGHFEVISMDEAMRRLTNGTGQDSRAVVITSDDGWMGFHRYGVRALRDRGLPATVYVTTSVLQGQVPWYVRWRLLLEQHPQMLALLARHVGRAEPFPNADSAISALKGLEYTRICSLWRQAVEIVPFEEGTLPSDWFIGENEVREALQSNITIGAHTVNHPILPREPEASLRREVNECKNTLEAISERPVLHFAYPNGDHSDLVIRCVQEAGYATAVTTTAGWNLPGQNLYRLRRVDVHEAACVDHRGRFSEAIFALWVTGEWERIKQRIGFLQ